MPINALETLITRLEEIAKKNDDKFIYRIDIRTSRFGRMEYHFVAQEEADRHEFAGGSGSNLEVMAGNVLVDLPAACSCWGYTL